MPVDLLVLPSPLLPSETYEPLREALVSEGYACAIAPTPQAGSVQEVVAGWASAAGAETSLIAHSNAGYLAPGVRSMSGSDQMIVFVDAALPPAAGETRLVPPELRVLLADLVDDHSGLLPAWTSWWPRDELVATIPEHLFETIDSRCPRLPLSYFDSVVEAPEGWADRSNAYLAFGDTYADELAFARANGWPTIRRSAANHLQLLWDPTGVADAVASLLRRSTPA